MKCDACGARNPSDASWCTQCYAFFALEPPVRDEPTAPSDPARSYDPAASSDPHELAEAHRRYVSGSGAPPTTSGLTPGADPVGPEVGGMHGEVASSEAESVAGASREGPVEVGDVREIGGAVQWRCRACQAWVGLEQARCATCGATRAGFGEAESTQVEVGELDERTILGASAAMPGLGHVLAGRTGSGATRMTLWVMWLLGGLWWSFSTSTGRTPGLLLLLGAAMLWAATLWDIRSLLQGAAEEPFGVRGLLWLVVGVTGLLMLTVALVATGTMG